MTHIFGIRHHGPGSARNLQRALEKRQPDCLLVEAPADAEKAIALIGAEGLEPPVALLIYDPKDLEKAVYLPFARFSPEWQAVRYAREAGIPVFCMDLPMALEFTLAREEERQPGLALAPEAEQEEAHLLRYDPMGYLARLAGFTDSERWWEHTFEQYESEDEIFDAILELMSLLRAEKVAEQPRTLLREAYMRKVLRKALKDGYQRPAVVCGAWHAPALHDLDHFKASRDNQLLRGIRKTKTEATWIPWSYERLSLQSGYRSGVISPAWYELLFDNRREVATRWMARVARLLRKEDLSASAAGALEAVRLADALATLRRKPVPGIDELQEAAVGVFCQGDEARLGFIRRRLVIGDAFGKVPADISRMPLLKDLEGAVKTARLTKAYQTSERIDKALDLRKDTNLLASRLLHRLQLLDIPWGKRKAASRFQEGSFKEEWQLKWQPDFAIRIIEAGILGSTVPEASAAAVLQKMREKNRLSELTSLIETVLNAELTTVIGGLLRRIQETAALSHDTLQLMAALPALVRITRYGNVRQTDVQAVGRLIDDFIPRICVGLPGACTGIEEEVARDLFSLLTQTNHAVFLLPDEGHHRQWLEAVQQVAGMEKAHRLLDGGATRLLLERRVISAEAAARQLSYHLSGAQTTADIALWLEGFLWGSGLLLVHQPLLWELVDTWVGNLAEGDFVETLPLLRRTFAAFSGPEREKMLAMAARSDSNDIPAAAAGEFDEERSKLLFPSLRHLLGMAGEDN